MVEPCVGSATDRWIVPQNFHGRIIGRGGENINKLCSLGVLVDVGKNTDAPSTVCVQGEFAARSAAKLMIEDLIGFAIGAEPPGRIVIRVPGRVKGRIIGPKGSVLNELSSKYRCRIDIPKDDDERVELIGPATQLQALKVAIDEKFDRGTRAEIVESELPDSSVCTLSVVEDVGPLLRHGTATVLHGVVAKWDEGKGFGFIQPREGGQQIFCHVRSLVRMCTKARNSIQEGTHVIYIEEYDVEKNSICAGRVQAEGGFLQNGGYPLPISLSAVDVSEALFFEDGEDTQKFVRFLDYLRSARKTIDVCVFSLTHDMIARVLITLHMCGVAVRVIVDDDQSTQQGSDVEKLRKAGIHVRMDHSERHMHHKFTILDGMCLLNGSFNYTQAAAEENEENILITNNRGLVASFSKHFEKLWDRFKR